MTEAGKGSPASPHFFAVSSGMHSSMVCNGMGFMGRPFKIPTTRGGQGLDRIINNPLPLLEAREFSEDPPRRQDISPPFIASAFSFPTEFLLAQWPRLSLYQPQRYQLHPLQNAKHDPHLGPDAVVIELHGKEGQGQQMIYFTEGSMLRKTADLAAPPALSPTPQESPDALLTSLCSLSPLCKRRERDAHTKTTFQRGLETRGFVIK